MARIAEYRALAARLGPRFLGARRNGLRSQACMRERFFCTHRSQGAPCQTTAVKGEHVASGGAFAAPLGVEPADLTDDWFAPSSERKELRVRVEARGVPTLDMFSPALEVVGWPISWLVHFAFFRGQWRVRMVEHRVGWYSSGRVRYSRLYQSRQDADKAASVLAQRIERARRAHPARD